MTMFQKIAFVGSPAEAGRMHSLLETAGFHPREDSSAHGALADAQHGVRDPVRAPDQRAQARGKLGECERLRQVVVGA